MKLGYACINESLPTKFRACRLATIEKKGKEIIKEITLHNFSETLKAIEWNIKNGILFYRLSSDVVSFGSHPINDWEWWKDEDVLKITNQIKKLKKEFNLRLSCHPGQFNILNSPKEDVVRKTLIELEHHNKMMDLIDGTDMILHIGGAYGDKEKAIERFIKKYKELPIAIKKKLRIENDDKVFTLEDVLFISKKTKAPVCFDIHHHNCNPSDIDLSTAMVEVYKSWEGFGTPKFHISSGKTGKTDRSHHDFVSKEDFEILVNLIGSREADIMFESKQKDKSVLPFL